jgi:hypothetical protein
MVEIQVLRIAVFFSRLVRDFDGSGDFKVAIL